MSRDRFRKWKLFKYNVPGASEASQVAPRVPAPGNQVAIRKKRGRPSNAKEGSGEPRDKGTAPAAAAGPAVLSRPLSSPRIFLLPETVISLTQQLFDWQLERQQRLRFEQSMDWWWTVECALRLIEANKLQEGFKELNQAFDRFAVMLQEPEIGLLPNFYHMLIRLGPLLGGQLVDYATRMAIIKLGRRHPLTLVFDTLRRAGPQEVRDGGYLILRTHFQAAERALGDTDAKMARYSAFILQALDWHHVDSSLPADSAAIEAELWRSYERLRAAGLDEDAQDTLVEIAMMHIRYGRYDAAKRLADQVVAWADACTAFAAAPLKGRAWRVRYLTALETDDMDECLLYGTNHLAIALGRFGPENPRFTALLAQAQAQFREKGWPELAVKLEQDIAEQGRVLHEVHDAEVKREVVEEEEGEGEEGEEEEA